MVQVQPTPTLKVQRGPLLAVGSTLDPESYVFASVELDASGGADATQVVPLLPDDGSVVLLALRAHRADGTSAKVTVTPQNGTTSGTAVEVDGTLLVAHPTVLGALVNDGPRTVSLTNAGDAPVTVDVLAALDPS
jgi:hypothetical protein